SWSRTIRTARSRTSGENGVVRFVMAPSSQKLEPPGNPGRFIPAKPPKVRYPFDVIGPQGRTWIEARWIITLAKMEARPSRSVVEQARKALDSFQERRLSRLDVQGCVLWLCDHYPDLTHTEMAGILDVTQQLVSRYVNVRSRQKASAERTKSQKPLDLGKMCISVEHENEASASGGARFITQAHNTPKNTWALASRAA
ncbi:hypothetical protein ACS5PV_31525, partial [Methylobacterium sp. Gmos1]